jgi:hypothetical protein
VVEILSLNYLYSFYNLHALDIFVYLQCKTFLFVVYL